MKIMKITEFHLRITKKYENYRILQENQENHENTGIPLSNHDIHENRIIPLENN